MRLAWIFAAAVCSAQSIPPNWQAALDSVSAASLNAHVSFLASDLLEGRGSPSRGLDIAAEYIASSFRRAGLDPVGDDGYFQTMNWKLLTPTMEGFVLEFEAGEKKLVIPAGDAAVNGSGAVDIAGVSPSEAGVRIGVVKSGRDYFQLTSNTAGLKAIIAIDPNGILQRRLRGRRLVDPESAPVPLIAVKRDGLEELAGKITRVTLHKAAASEQPARIRNVTGLLRGSDRSLEHTHVVLSAHYDHLGIDPAREGDQIFNGANDDASGTATVMELAGAFARMQPRPRRSILFVAFAAEEQGLMGSRYYARRPLLPLANAIANINLEQLGRTDGDGGDQTGRMNATGFDYTDIAASFLRAAESVGIALVKHERYNEQFFSQSDNLALSEKGVPSTTFSSAYEFAEYHQVGDHAGKLNYNHLAKVTRAIGVGLAWLANDTAAPEWNPAAKGAKPFISARPAASEARTPAQ
jgi:hypothetical protein